MNQGPVIIVGAGIGGLVTALELHQAGIPCRIYEAAPELRPLGVGINLLPHATAVLGDLGVMDDLMAIGIETKESIFFNRFGQKIYAEPAGRAAGHAWPQLSIHRGELQLRLAEIVRDRLGEDALVLDHQAARVGQDDRSATVVFRSMTTGKELGSATGDVVIGADGVHSAVRKGFYPDEGAPKHSGVVMWRGTTIAPPFLTGASMVRAGWLRDGKLVIYPIKHNADGKGNQLVNWVAEIEAPHDGERNWGKPGDPADFMPAFADWHFDWLDVPALLTEAKTVLEYPMVDQDPLPRWTFGRVTLLGDAAHPMVPRGSNGAGQAILDAHRLREALESEPDRPAALAAYEADRLPKTTAVVLTNRTNPPDAILREVWERTGDRPFENINDVISEAELAAISSNYQAVAGFSAPAATE
jgi:2-polyprenyl-6-methoxyphenol hydroxylase-like FAD-dependent oxidoreductase